MNKEEILALMANDGFEMSLGETAYNAFAERKEWKNFDGKPLSKFDAMPENFRQAWQAFAYAISKQFSVNEAWDSYYNTVVGKTWSGAEPYSYAQIAQTNEKTTAALNESALAIRNAVEHKVAKSKLRVI